MELSCGVESWSRVMKWYGAVEWRNALKWNFGVELWNVRVELHSEVMD